MKPGINLRTVLTYETLRTITFFGIPHPTLRKIYLRIIFKIVQCVIVTLCKEYIIFLLKNVNMKLVINRFSSWGVLAYFYTNFYTKSSYINVIYSRISYSAFNLFQFHFRNHIH